MVTGKVRFGYIHLAFLGAASNLSAEASECAAEQNKFWEYHDLLFSGFAGGNRPSYTAANLKKWAGELELNQVDFDACLDSEKYTELVATQTSTFQGIGVQSTPSFILNGKPLVGALPYESFKQAIDAELNAK